MKQTIFVLSIAVIFIGGIAIYQTTEKNEIKADFETFKENTDTYIKKELNDQRKHITDSLRTYFESLPPDTVIKNQIQTKYDTTIIRIHSMPANDQFRWSANELERLYQNGFGVHFKSGPLN